LPDLRDARRVVNRGFTNRYGQHGREDRRRRRAGFTAGIPRW
jgi:hypothetical protein